MELVAWMKGKRIAPASNPSALYYDNPTETPAAQLRNEACVPVPRPFSPEGKFKLKEFPKCLVAETKHEGPPEEYTRTYGSFLEGLLRGGYELISPAREFYLEARQGPGPGMGYMIQQPIAKRA